MGARRIAFINEKGGTCKTTLAVHTAAWLATEKGLRVLLMDLDTQGHGGKSLGIDVRDVSLTIADVLVDETLAPEAAILETDVSGLDIMPSNRGLADLPERLALMPDRHRRLRYITDAVDDGGEYDLIVFDAPPSLGLITLNIMLATREVVVPVALTYFSLDGCAEIVRTVEQVREEHGHDELEVTLVVPTLYRRTRLADEVLAKLREYFGGRVAPTLGFNVKIDEAQSHGKTIWEHAPWSRGAQMLEAIAKDAWKRGRRRSAPSRP